ncbi:MAG: 3'-5' exonuclease, partial [Edaphobacter sp.]
QARVERFVRTMLAERLGDLPVRRLRLTANFRSQGQLVEEFNQDFSLLFPREADAGSPEEVPYVQATPVRPPARYGARSSVWHSNVLPGGLSTDDARAARRDQSKRNALEIRAIIERWRSMPLPEERDEPWKIAVLVRDRKLLTDIVAELKKDEGHGAIPFRAVDIEQLGERQEILDLFALTRALLHPADRVAWLAVLHAPWCGLGLAELHVLTGGDEPDWAERSIEDVIAERGDLLCEESCERLARLWQVLHMAAAHHSRLTLAQLVERTWRSLGGDAYLKPTEMANARRYLQLLDEMEQQSRTIDLGLLRRRLHDLYAQPDTSVGAVDLMTIHKSKGLEWDVVIVPGLEKKARPNSGRLLAWDEIDSNDETAARVVLAPIKSKGGDSKELNDWLNGVRSAREAAEQKRLFYVASTRAREELHLFGTAETNAKGEIRPPASSLLHTAWPAAQRHFAVPAELPAIEPTMFGVLPQGMTGEEFVGDIAAGGRETPQPPLLHRLPLLFDPRSRFVTASPLSRNDTGPQPEATHFARPEGSFEARAFGNAVHAFLEMLTKRLSEGAAAESLHHEVAGWDSRIAAVLRGDGVPPASLERRVAQVKTALTNALQDAEGLWILAALDEAASEYALTSWTESRRSVRLDRVFRAGPEPLATGRECIWIVDYKTTTHGREGVDAFLEGERAKYGPQMEAYARMMQAGEPTREIRVGLYYPMLPKLIWWTPESV